MEFEKGNLYHIFNQGNNQRKIFFEHKNYLFFLEKIRTYISPYADILAWCLMPNHFHLMIRVNEVELTKASLSAKTKSFDDLKSNQVRASLAKSDDLNSNQVKASLEAKPSLDSLKPTPSMRTLNDSIGIMLRSYTSAINKKQGSSGSLFRQSTKAQCIDCPNALTPSFYEDDGVTKINISDPFTQYPQNCFDYIHQNPVKARLTNKATDWEFSSAKDYAELRKGNLVNINVALEYVDSNK